MRPFLFQASAKVVKFLNHQHQSIKDNMDGKNVEAVLLELGIRLHRIIYDHLCTFTYNCLGKNISPVYIYL